MPDEGEPRLRALCERLRVPNEPRELALIALRCRAPLEAAERAAARQLLELLKLADALRRAERFAELLALARAAGVSGAALERVERARAAAAGLDAGAIAAAAASSAEIPRRLDAARERAIAEALQGRPA
jgi:tRNA nucleotidyltransferase (CCA-adding enzyme)